MKRSILSIVIVTSLVFSLRLPAFAAFAAVQTVSIGELGHPGDQTSYGARPALSFYLPVYRSVRSIRFHAAIRVSPAVDPGSTITLTSGGTPLWSEPVDALRKHPNVDVALPLPDLPQRTLDVTIAGAFSHVGDVCSRFDSSSLFLTVARGSGFTVTLDPVSSTIAGFLETYNGKFAVVVPDNASSERKRSSVRLAYRIAQLYHWRHAAVSLRSSLDPDARNFILGDFKTDLVARGNRLEVGPNGDALLTREIDPLLITTSVDAAHLSPSAPPSSGSHVSLNDLGLTTATDSGDHPSFSIPFNLARVGGLPTGLRLNASLAHTALGPDERATLNVSINNALVDSVPLEQLRGRQNLEVAIPAELVASANDVRLSIDYDAKRDCHVAPPRFTTTLYDDTFFHWDGVTPYTLSVGDFFRSASGRVVVLVDGDRLIPYAFAVLSTLGSGNANITSIDVLPFDGKLPSGYDAAIVVAPLNHLSGWSLPVTSDGTRIVLGEGAPPIAARYSDPFGVLESASINDIPVLIASFWKDARANGGLSDLGSTTIGNQTDRVFMFQSANALYASTAPRPHIVRQSFLMRFALPIGAAIGIMLVSVVVVARRRRTGGKVA